MRCASVITDHPADCDRKWKETSPAGPRQKRVLLFSIPPSSCSATRLATGQRIVPAAAHSIRHHWLQRQRIYWPCLLWIIDVGHQPLQSLLAPFVPLADNSRQGLVHLFNGHAVSDHAVALCLDASGHQTYQHFVD